MKYIFLFRQGEVYDNIGRQLAPTYTKDPMYSELYCQEYITDCDRIITITFYGYRLTNNYINVYTGRQVKPITIRIDT